MIPALGGVIRPSPKGLYCPEGDFYIDPRQPVPRAVITHAHADHARPGSTTYLCAEPGRALLQVRMGCGANVRSLAYGERLRINGAVLSLHPAGHILGSAQVKIEVGGRICVISGDYKADPDPTCTPLSPQACHTFISESTFGLPIFKWPAPGQLNQEIHVWWQTNQAQGRTSVLFAYALGKAQRILAGLGADQGPILTHGAVERITQCYREAGIALPATQYIGEVQDRRMFAQALVIAPPSADHPAWLKRFPRRSRAFASGWMRIRGNRRRRAVDRGFVLSDHSDWEGLLDTITATGAEHIGLTHGYALEMARWLNGQGLRAEAVLEPPRDPGDPPKGPREEPR